MPEANLPAIIPVMNTRGVLFSGAVLVTYALFGIASFLPLPTMWGINHLMFFPAWGKYLYLAGGLLLVYLLFGKLPERGIETVLEKAGHWLWEGVWWHRGIVSITFLLIFYLAKTQTHFLGDGYSWLHVFGHSEGYTNAGIEPASIAAVKTLQSLLGGFTYDNAISAFRILSFASGLIVVYNLIYMAGKVFTESRLRLFGLFTLVFSGTLLLFFGYIEFYPMLWAMVSLFIRFSLDYLEERRYLTWALLFFVLAIAVHLQAVYLLPSAILVLLSLRFKDAYWLKWAGWSGYVWIALIAVGFLSVAVLKSIGGDLGRPFLSFISSLPNYPSYAIFSKCHLLDVLNLILLIFPASLAIIVSGIKSEKQEPANRITLEQFFLWSALGSLLFLLTIHPVLGMARDWDLMSLTLLAPVCFLLLRARESLLRLSTGYILSYALLVAFMTTSYVVVSCNSEFAVRRMFTILHEYGNKDRGGWIYFTEYLRSQKDNEGYDRAVSEMHTYFPEYQLLDSARLLIYRGKSDEAYAIAVQLVGMKPHQADFLQLLAGLQVDRREYRLAEENYLKALETKKYHSVYNELGQLYQKQGRYAEALKVFTEAHRLAPEATFVTEGLGLTYIYLKDFPAALMLADTLFQADSTSPGGHLLKMSIALNEGDMNAARKHYRAYLEYGKGRSDYNNIKAYYNYLQ